MEIEEALLLGIPRQVYGERGSARLGGEENNEGKKRKHARIETACEKEKKEDVHESRGKQRRGGSLK